MVTTKRRFSKDPLLDTHPERYLEFEDGCDIHDHCLSCPLPKCRYDDPPGWLWEGMRWSSDSRIALLISDMEVPLGKRTAKAIAAKLGVSARTVYRAKKRLMTTGITAAPDELGGEA